MRKWGCQKVTELDWHGSSTHAALSITALPANHFSSRGTRDRNTSLWCGYLISSAQKKIYYVGDTGYSPVFEKTGKEYGPFDLCLIPIGAYLPRWFMGPIHVSPEQSVQVHKDLNSHKSVAMHFGTFKLADDNPLRAKKELKEALEKNNLTEEDFHIPNEGHSYLV